MDIRINEKPVEKKEKLSHWWAGYHLWSGFCLWTFVDISGLFDLILGSPKSPDPASAGRHAVLGGLLAAGFVMLGYFLSKNIVKAIDNRFLSKRAKTTIKVILPFAYFVGAILLAMVTSPIFTSIGGDRNDKAFTYKTNAIAPIIVISSVQSAEGVTDADLDLVTLKILETWTVNTILEKGKSKYAELGYDPNTFNPEIDANSVYVSVSGKKLAVIRINIGNLIRAVTIMGIKGNELHRVGCMRSSNHDIPVWSGECGNKIQEVFGVTLQP